MVERKTANKQIYVTLSGAKEKYVTNNESSQ